MINQSLLPTETDVRFFEENGYWLGGKVVSDERLERLCEVISKAGEVSFHPSLTVHGSGPNTTDKPRRSFVIHMMPADAYDIAGSPNDNPMNAILVRERGGRHGNRFTGDPWLILFSA